jgi:hypothetical protein
MNITVKENARIGEKYYYMKHRSGLDIYVIPKKLTSAYALFCTRYGAVDNCFKLAGEEEFTRVPDGIAHYLEHKMFENEDGFDTFSRFPAYGATFVRVFVDGIERGIAVYPPYTLKIPAIDAGEHTLTLELCIPRTNAFGPVHHFKGSGAKAAPKSWRTEDERWSEEYRLTVQGLTKAPVIKEIK